MKKAMSPILLLLVIAGVFLAGSWYGRQGADKVATPGARKILYYVDPMHPAYKSDKPGIAPDCGMDLMPVYEDGSMGGGGGKAASGPPGSVNVSPEKQQLIGVRVSPVEKAAGTQTLRILGRVAPDETRLYRVNAPVDGWFQEISPVTTGSQVEKDQFLATFAAQELVFSAQQYIFALNGMDRLTESGQESPAKLNPVNSNFRQRIERLQGLGMAASQMEEIRHTREIPQGIKLFAPAAGFVLSRNVSPGQRFEKGAEWYRIADLTQVWIVADVFKHEAKHFRPGMVARVTLPDDPDVILHARVSHVQSQFDATTRTLKVRLETDNPGFALRPDMFVDVELPITLPPAIAVSADAVLDSGLKKTVFVDRGEGIFEPRSVETGWRLGDRIEIVAGLKPGERIVVSGTFLLDSESRMKLVAAGVSGTSSKDPVCDRDVEEGKGKAAGLTSEYQGKTYFFSSEECKATFDKEPRRYAGGPTEKKEGLRPQDLRNVEWRGAAVTASETWGSAPRDMGRTSGSPSREGHQHD